MLYQCHKGHVDHALVHNVSFDLPAGHEFEPSMILTNNTDYYKLLSGWLGPVTAMPSKWRLCYRATDHGWSASTFHSQCNSLGPSVTFVKVNEYIFGGYTDRYWREYNLVYRDEGSIKYTLYMLN